MKCEQCGRNVFLPYECSFCSGKFCKDHRLAENHNCRYAPVRTPLGHWKAKTTPKEKPVDHAEIILSEGDFHFIKAKVPIYQWQRRKRAKSGRKQKASEETE